jgi:hypothetical protein
MFPQGGPGVALVLLRCSIVVSLVCTVARHPGAAGSPLVLAAVVLVSLCLAVGLGTPILATVVAASAVTEMMGFQVPVRGSSSILLLDAAALGLLGPGAYSIDARLFGRRVTVMPAPPAAPTSERSPSGAVATQRRSSDQPSAGNKA